MWSQVRGRGKFSFLLKLIKIKIETYPMSLSKIKFYSNSLYIITIILYNVRKVTINFTLLNNGLSNMTR